MEWHSLPSSIACWESFFYTCTLFCEYYKELDHIFLCPNVTLTFCHFHCVARNPVFRLGQIHHDLCHPLGDAPLLYPGPCCQIFHDHFLVGWSFRLLAFLYNINTEKLKILNTCQDFIDIWNNQNGKNSVQPNTVQDFIYIFLWWWTIFKYALPELILSIVISPPWRPRIIVIFHFPWFPVLPSTTRGAGLCGFVCKYL